MVVERRGYYIKTFYYHADCPRFIAQERRRSPRVGRTPTLEESESDRSHQGEEEVVEDLVTPNRTSEYQLPLNSEAPEFIVPEATPPTEDEATGEAPIFEMDSKHTTESPIQAERTRSQRAEQNLGEQPSVTRSGRLSKPPERFGVNPTWTHKVVVLLSLLNQDNQIVHPERVTGMACYSILSAI